MMNLKILALLSFTLAIASAKYYEVDLSDPTILEKLSHSAVKLQVGDKVRLVADENPTTGYVWIIDYPAANDALYKVESTDYQQS